MKKLLFLASAMLAWNSGNAQTTTYTQVSLTGYNADIIANGTGTAMSSTTHDADGVNVLAAQNFVNPSNQTPAANTALPNSGIINSAVSSTPGLTYQLAPYTGNNVLRVVGNSSGTLTFSTPISTTDLYVLLAPVAYTGTIASAFTVNFTDGTNQVFSGITLNNWYGTSGAAWSGTTRANRSTSALDVQTGGPRLLQQKLTLSAVNAAKSIQSILVANNSALSTNNVIHVLAVSALTTASTLATDAGITSIIAPVSGCGLTNAETITVAVKNFGTTPQSNIPVSYKINGGTPVNEVIPGPIAANTSVNYSFTTKANLSTIGTYSIEARTNLTGDLAPTNDATTKSVVLSATPATPGISPATSATLCSGSTVTLTASSSTPGVSYQWFNNGTAIANATNATYIANASGSFTVTAVLNGCNSTASAATVVTVNTTPPAPGLNASSSTAICAGDSVMLTAVSSAPNATFNWYMNGNIMTGATTANYAAKVAGSYTAVAVVNGCSSPASMARTVTVKQVPTTPVITQNGSLLISSSNTGNQWYKNGVAIPGATVQSLNASANGTYTVKVTTNGCTSAASNAVTIANTGISDDMKNMAVAVYPNPSNGLFRLSLPKGRHFEMTITDLTGKVIRKEKINAKTTEIDLQKAAKGIYILKLESEGKTATQKLVIE